MNVKQLSQEELEKQLADSITAFETTHAADGSSESVLKADTLREFGEAQPYTLANFEAAMQYQPWNLRQRDAGDIVREALTVAGKAILRAVPPGRFREKALDAIVQARMDANAAISFRGRF